jgi:hypothetical protein
MCLQQGKGFQLQEGYNVWNKTCKLYGGKVTKEELHTFYLNTYKIILKCSICVVTNSNRPTVQAVHLLLEEKMLQLFLKTGIQYIYMS